MNSPASQNPDDNGAPASDPLIVLFAEAEQLPAITGTASRLAAIVVSGESDETTQNELRRSGCPVLVRNGSPADGHAANGLHIDGPPDDVRRARNALMDGTMLGAGPAMTRHAGLDLGEAQPDYVMFGKIAVDTSTEDVRPADELIIWWADVIEVPSVAVAVTRGDVTELLRAGADFVAVSSLVWSSDNPENTLETLINDAAASRGEVGAIA